MKDVAWLRLAPVDMSGATRNNRRYVNTLSSLFFFSNGFLIGWTVYFPYLQRKEPEDAEKSRVSDCVVRPMENL